MSITSAYLITTKNIQGVFDALLQAQAPKKVTVKFLENIGFNSSNDRKYIPLFKSLGLINENGEPTARYHSFLDKSISKNIIADGIREAYDELFQINKEAYQMSVEDVKNKFRTITRGEKTDKVVGLMATTFTELCKYADWSDKNKLDNKINNEEPEIKLINNDDNNNNKDIEENNKNSNNSNLGRYNNDNINLHYNIQIHLPETTNIDVYNAIFESLKKHLI
ncbi:DUF5343 domain-containing protein [uncultured Brachyspira sp.]|jgi:hypothetical protein|uniref:DUF5343 domain-containing protein n=1 Tax=uncultured Brachyspira sp. TaxID=221953 RepID=UPI003209F09C